MVQTGCGCHHGIWSGLGVGVTIVYGWARVAMHSVLKSGPVWSFDPFWAGLQLD